MSFSDEYFKLVEEEKKKKKKTYNTSFEEKYWGLVENSSTPTTRKEEPYTPSFSSKKNSNKDSSIFEWLSSFSDRVVDNANKKSAEKKQTKTEETKAEQKNTPNSGANETEFSQYLSNILNGPREQRKLPSVDANGNIVTSTENNSINLKNILSGERTAPQIVQQQSVPYVKYENGKIVKSPLMKKKTTLEEDRQAKMARREIERKEAYWAKPSLNNAAVLFRPIGEFIEGIPSDIEYVMNDLFDDIMSVTEKGVDTVADAVLDVAQGVLSTAEDFGDAVNYGASYMFDVVGADSVAKWLKNSAKKDATGTLTNGLESKLEENSILPEWADSVGEGLGQVASTILTGNLGAAAGLSTTGVSALTSAFTGITGFGSGVSEAYANGASDWDAAKHGLNEFFNNVATESMFGGFGKWSNAIGFGKSAIPIDDILAKAATSGITNRAVKSLAQYGIKATAEGVEEAVAGFLSAVSKSNTYLKEKDFDEILADENLFAQFFTGAFISGIVQVPSVRNSIKTGRDYITGYTQNEQAVIDKVVENKIAEKEQNGNKLTNREKSKIEEQVKSDLEKGNISTDTIEEILGGETYENYKKAQEQEQADLKELAELYEGEELQQQIETYVSNSKLGEMRTNLSNEVYESVKDGYLGESYIQREKRKTAFTADLTEYEEKYHPTIQKAIDSGILNDTRKTHDFVDLIAKISADKGVNFEFANNEKIKNSSFAVEGKIVNGYVSGDTIGLNIESNKALEKTVGHEISHILEGTDLYDTLQNAAFEYAKSRKASDSKFANEYLERLYNTQELYKNIEGYQGAEGFAKIKKEVAADLVGDYIFTDEQFVRNLSTNHKNIFKKIYDEIKYMCKVATAGSEQARQLEKVKKLFDEVYRESGSVKTENAKGVNGNKNKKYSLSETDAEYLTAVEGGDTQKAQKIVEDAAKEAGYDIKAYHGTGYDFTVFDKAKQGDNYQDWGRLGKGFYFAPTSREAETWAELSKGTKNKVMPVYLRSENMLDSFEALPDNLKDTIPENWDSLTRRLAEKYAYNYIEYMQEFGYNVQEILTQKGYDGINGHTEFVVFDPEQVKSADAITYDDKGNVIPLSERFNTANEDIRYSLSENELDNGNDMVYNGKRGEVYVATDEFRNLQAECQGMSYEDTQSYWSGLKQVDDGLRRRLSGSVKQILLDSTSNGRSNDSRLLEFTAKGNQFNIYENVNASLFHDVFEIARKHLSNGELVDLHKPETTDEHGIGYKYCNNYLSEDGLSGFSITPDGDLISVFNASGKNGFLRAIAPFVKENAKTLDCYISPIQNLQRMYEDIFGFKTASILEHNMEFDHDNIAKNHKNPKVAFMVNTESNVETKEFAKELYDDAVAYRNGFIVSENGASAKHSLSNKGEQPSAIGTPAKDLYLAPTREDIAKMENTSNEVVAENSMFEAPLPDESTIPPEVEYYNTPDTTALDEKALKNIGKKMRETLYLNAEEKKAIQDIVQKYSTNEMPSREELFAEIKEKFGEKTWSERNEDIAEVKRVLKGYRFKVSDTIRGDVAYKYGTWTNFRKQYSGRLNFAKDGLDVDVAYMELSSEYPAFFPADIANEADQLSQIADVADMSIREYNSMPLDNDTIQEAVNIISDEVRNYKENAARVASEEYAREALDSVAPPKAEQLANGTAEDAHLLQSLDNYPIKTVDDRLAEQIRAAETELAEKKQLMREMVADYNNEIERLGEEYLSKKNRKTKVADNIANRVSSLAARKDDLEATYAKRISDLEAKLQKLKDEKYSRALHKQEKMTGYAEWAENLIGDTSTWKDKNMGIQYEVNTEHRNLRDIVRDADGNKDIKKADEINDAINGQYNREEAAKKRELAEIRKKYADLKITKAEDAYIQMLGELRGNPDTTLTEKVVNEYYEKHKNKIDKAKVEKVIEMARQDYDYLLNKVNATLREQGMKEIPYRQGYFPHFTEPKQNFIQKLLNWKTQDNEIPTSIAGLTEDFKPVKKYQSFDKQRHGDTTDYSFLKGFDNYSEGALDWAYHLETLQKRRAIENHIRYTHSDEGIQAKIKEVYADETLDADEAQAKIEQILTEAKNPLNNFVQDFMTKTNILAGKKNSLDRAMEQKTNRKIYSTMTNVQNRMSANMVLANFRSALTNFIPITQSWAQVSPLKSLQATKDTIANSFKDDGLVNKSTFLTNRLREADNLHKTTWDKVLDKAGIMFEVVDNFSSQVIWRSKYNDNLSKGMSESEAIANADQFAENVMAGRSKGNEPTLFNAKNPFVKAFTMFQLEVNNQYGYLFKDVPTDLKAETNHWKLNMAKGLTTAFVGAYVYNALLEQISGSGAALDPLGIIEDLLRDLGLFDDDEEKEGTETALNFAENIVEELPFVGGLFGGGRIPISSALPYEDDGLKGFLEDLNNIGEGGGTNILKELHKSLLTVGLPVGGGQIKKSVQGNRMFNTDDEHPIAGSYTDSGDLRFPVEDNVWNRIQANLFGQWANENARDYIDNGRKPLSPEQTQEYIDVDLPIADYWKYRDGLKGLKTNAEKADYINSLDITDEQKNLLMNNILDRKEDVDMSNYGDYNTWDEFDYAQKNPEKYEFFKANGISYSAYKSADEDGKAAYNWAYNNPEGYTVSKAITNDVVKYRSYTSDLDAIRADKDANGKSISGTAKTKKIEYINSLDLDYGAKIILFRSEYPGDDTYNEDIINYINNHNDLSYEERVAIYTQLGFTVKNGYVYWD